MPPPENPWVKIPLDSPINIHKPNFFIYDSLLNERLCDLPHDKELAPSIIPLLAGLIVYPLRNKKFLLMASIFLCFLSQVYFSFYSLF